DGVCSPMHLRRLKLLRWATNLVAGLVLVTASSNASAGTAKGPSQFKSEIKPILAKYCYDCHGEGEKKGNLALDDFKTDAQLMENHDLWWNVLKNVQAGLMPPAKKARPAAGDLAKLEEWIKLGPFGIDPKNPDPGKVTIRRLNRAEYKNTIRDLMGVEFESEIEFPPDDSGHGF